MSMKKILAGIALVGLVFAASKTHYYAGKVGYEWTYTGDYKRVMSKAAGKSLVLDNYSNGTLISSDIMTFVNNGGVFLEGMIIGGKTTKYVPKVAYLPKPPLQVGQTWNSVSSFGGEPYTLQSQVVESVGVKVGAGKFNTFRIRQVATSGGISTSTDIYYQPGLGIVRITAEDGTNTDLIKYKLPNK